MSESDSSDDVTSVVDSAITKLPCELNVHLHKNELAYDNERNVGHIVTEFQVPDNICINNNNTSHYSQNVFVNNAFVNTSHSLLSTGNTATTDDRLKTHVVFHSGKLDESAKIDIAPGESGLRSPTTPLPPPTPSSPDSRERGLRYQWDATAFNNVIPVRCKNSSAELHKSKFGSGGRGRCICMGGSWYTPSEFEALCGRASSKDWKRSIRFGGRTLQCLIEDNILQPHAASCTCAACCDDESVTGPVRLFVPYKRRKKDRSGDLGDPEVKKKVLSQSPPKQVAPMPVTDNVNATPKDAHQTVSLDNALSAIPVQLTRACDGAAIQVFATAENRGTDVSTGDGFVVNNMPALTPQPVKSAPAQAFPQVDGVNSVEEKIWWQLEEMAASIVNQTVQLRSLVEQSKQACMKVQESQLKALKEQMQKANNEAINVVRIEQQIKHQQALREERAHKDMLMQQAFAQVRAAMPDTNNATLVSKTNTQNADVTLVTDGKNTYSVSWVNPTDNVNFLQGNKDPVK